MKKCSRCTKPATLHITEITDGEVQELHLCETCAQEYLSSSTNQTTDEPSALAAKFAETAEVENLEELDDLTCPSCELTFREFRNQGRLGCPHCYVAFKTELLPLLENIHGETQHTGKFPKRAPGESRRQFRLIKLRSELRNAINEEEYELAAQIRDEIQQIETEINTEGE